MSDNPRHDKPENWSPVAHALLRQATNVLADLHSAVIGNPWTTGIDRAWAAAVIGDALELDRPTDSAEAS